jgi:hypothetical protein
MKVFLLVGASALAVSLTSCAMFKNYPMHGCDNSGIAENDACRIHDLGAMTQRHGRSIDLDEQRIDEIKKYGITIDPSERRIDYLRVTKKRRGGGVIGNIFAVNGKGEFGNYELLVCVHRNKLIKEIYVKSNPGTATVLLS